MQKTFLVSISVFLVIVSFLVNCVSATAQEKKVDSFRPLNTFVVPDGGVAEIISSTPDGKKVIYTNADDKNIGIVDITNPLAPILETTIEMPGEPTSVAVTPDGSLAIAAVNTSILKEGEKPVVQDGKLVFIDLGTNDVRGELSIGAGPDSIAVTELNGKILAVVAIENEPIIVDENGNLLDEDEPGLDGDISKPGYVQIITINSEIPKQSTIINIEFPEQLLSDKELLYPDDPQPEFIDIKNNKAAVTLQENNGVAVINLANGTIESIFSLGKVKNQPADLIEDNIISFTQMYPKDVEDKSGFVGARMPDAIAWNAEGTTLLTADEGEMDFSGGRGWSVWASNGKALWNDAGSLEKEAAKYGQYPEGRSEDNGIEVEGVETGVFGNKEFAFLGSEKGSFVAVYDIKNPSSPKFIQLLPTGMKPEGLLALPQRNLFLTADEDSGTITIFEGMQGIYRAPVNRPMLQSAKPDVYWSAISGLASDAKKDNVLYAVPDIAMLPAIYQIDLHQGRGLVSNLVPITKNGELAQCDLEGIALDTSIVGGKHPGFWLASEGNAKYGKEDYIQNLLIQVDAQGRVLREIGLPEEIDSADGGMIRNNGFEGITVSSDGRYLVAAVQRDYVADETIEGVHYTRIARYDLLDEKWEFFLYPLENSTVDMNWIGLSEIINLGSDRYAVIERDKQVGGAVKLKAVYTFRLEGLKPYDGATSPSKTITGSVIDKELLLDLRQDFAPYEKVEGLAVTPSGMIWAALDNDGGEVENRLSAVGQLQNIVK